MDGVSRADCGAWGNKVVAKTASYTIPAPEVGRVFTNAGAQGAVTFTLPAPKAGMWFTFVKVVNQNLLIKATGGAKINGGTADKVYKNTAAETGLATCTIFSDGTDWYVAGSAGTWANDNA
jgi:hypothetical protein